MNTLYFLTKGSSDSISTLNAFDCSLLDAGIGDTNLIKMSSILPPYSKKIDKPKIPQGLFIFTAYAFISSTTPNEIISSAVAVGIPEDESQAGLIMEFSARDKEDVVVDTVIKMVEEGMHVRKRKIKKIEYISATHTVVNVGGAFAGLVLLSQNMFHNNNFINFI